MTKEITPAPAPQVRKDFTITHEQAFADYVAMEPPSLKELVARYKLMYRRPPGEGTIKRWSMVHKWKSRRKAIKAQAELAQAAQEAALPPTDDITQLSPAAFVAKDELRQVAACLVKNIKEILKSKELSDQHKMLLQNSVGISRLADATMNFIKLSEELQKTSVPDKDAEQKAAKPAARSASIQDFSLVANRQLDKVKHQPTGDIVN